MRVGGLNIEAYHWLLNWLGGEVDWLGCGRIELELDGLAYFRRGVDLQIWVKVLILDLRGGPWIAFEGWGALRHEGRLAFVILD